MSVNKLREIGKNYTVGETIIKAIQNVSFDINESEFIIIFGRSGSGKSTLISLIGGLESPSRGEIIIGEQDITKISQNQLALLRRTKIGFVFQHAHLLEYLTVLENVLLPVTLSGKQDTAAIDRALEILDHVGMKHKQDNYPSELSTGEKQQVAIARSLIHKTQILIADEPTGNLDTENTQNILKLLFSFWTDTELRKECLNKAKGKRNYLQLLKRQIEKELAEAEESVRIWTKESA